MKKSYKKASLNTKLNAFAAVILVPCIIMVLYLLYSLVTFCNAYNQIVINVTGANTYYIDLKKDVDYAIYRIVIGSADIDNLEDNQDIKDPYTTIAEAREAFEKLSKGTEKHSNEAKAHLKAILNRLNTLEKNVNSVIESTRKGGSYDDNIEFWEFNVCGVTSLIQENISEYIYYETDRMNVVREGLELKEQQTIRVIVVVLIIMLSGILLLSLRLSRSIAGPIQRLCRTTELVSQGDFSIRAQQSAGNEITQLNNSFNMMVERIGGLIEDIKTEQLNLRATELKLLQAQINPHFLYNTFDTITWLAEGGETSKVVTIVTYLSDFFRTTLSKGKDYIAVEEEESHIRSYLQIQQIRYQDILEYEIHIDSGIKNYFILKLTLQPLVENAIYHGIKNKRGKGKILVHGYQAENNLIFTVEDNGIGMQETVLADLQRRLQGTPDQCAADMDGPGGFGLANVAERIRLNYGNEYGMILESTYREGTRVTVRIPVKKA